MARSQSGFTVHVFCTLIVEQFPVEKWMNFHSESHFTIKAPLLTFYTVNDTVISHFLSAPSPHTLSLLSQIDWFLFFKARLIITHLLRVGRIPHFFQHGTKGNAIPEIGDNSLWILQGK